MNEFQRSKKKKEEEKEKEKKIVFHFMLSDLSGDSKSVCVCVSLKFCIHHRECGLVS